MEPPPIPPPLPAGAHGEPAIRWQRAGAVLAAAMIVAVIVLDLSTYRASAVGKAAQGPKPNPIAELSARYAYGAKLMLRQAKQWDAAKAKDLAQAIPGSEQSPIEEFRSQIVRSALIDQPAPERKLEQVAADAPELARDVEILRTAQHESSEVSTEDWQWLESRHGWLARLVRAQFLPADAPELKRLHDEALMTVVAYLVLFVSILFLLLAGTVILARFCFKWRSRGVNAAIARPSPAAGGVMLEAFAIYMAAWSAPAAIGSRLWPGLPPWIWYVIGVMGVAVAIAWPVLRGMNARSLRLSLGLHRGAGFWREVRAGALGWLAGLPLMAVGVGLSILLARLTKTLPSHPITDFFNSGGIMVVLALLLAVVWAPLAEEIMFRGFLFPALASWLRWTAGILLGAFIFAVIHPQGWVGVPPIMALAITFSVLRLWRGSLIAPMTAHAINNGLATLFMLLAFG